MTRLLGIEMIYLISFFPVINDRDILQGFDDPNNLCIAPSSDVLTAMRRSRESTLAFPHRFGIDKGGEPATKKMKTGNFTCLKGSTKTKNITYVTLHSS